MTSTDTAPPSDSPGEQADDGAFKRKDSRFRDWIRADGSTDYTPEAGRYHLYVSSACPWAHRTIIYRYLKGLEDVISMTIVDPERGERGWAITNERGTTPDPVNDFTFLSEGYALTDPAFDGRVTVPVLWDRENGRIVNNESADIIRMFDLEFAALAQKPEPVWCPGELRPEIDEINAFVYENVNDGVYRAGFARTQAAYERAFGRLFDALDELDARLATTRYLAGTTITEADWRLFTTLLRFDPVYVGHFQCNLRRIVDYPQLSGYLRELYQYPGIAATVDMDHIKRHYYRTHPQINPMLIVPVGPALDLTAPHGRDHLGQTPRSSR
ncbi:MAG: glutathionyl-hydroquinone reductase [Gaiellales bacterium]|nr:glutathionyl-hydroquinone reductase [Gaiellales bacterium]